MTQIKRPLFNQDIIKPMPKASYEDNTKMIVSRGGCLAKLSNFFYKLISNECVSSLLIYTAISSFFLFGVLTSHGSVAQQDWSVQLSGAAAYKDLTSVFYLWQYNGFGGVNAAVGPLPVTIVLYLLSTFGFIAGTEIKILAVSLLVLNGVSAYLLARSFKMQIFTALLVGLFYMTTPLVFDMLMFGWVFYLLTYAMLPLMILTARKFLQNGRARYALLGGVLLSLTTGTLLALVLYPFVILLYVIFESRSNWRLILKGIAFIFSSLIISFLSILYFFIPSSVSADLSFHLSNFVGVIIAQFSHLGLFLNTMRLWGGTYNFQFETYFPHTLILFSFVILLVVPVALLLKPHNRHVIFFAICYLLFVLITYYFYKNFSFIIYKIPYGVITESFSVLLFPAALGLAMLIGYITYHLTTRSKNIPIRATVVITVLILIILAGAPWWTGQTSGNIIQGPPTKLNLYQEPTGYLEWNNMINADNNYFVLYLPGGGNAQIKNTTYYSGMFEGVSGSIFYQTNNLPSINPSYTDELLASLLTTKDAQVAQSWGLMGIKYIVIYTNVIAPYNLSDLTNNLSHQAGIVKVANLPDVVVFEDELAKPVVYSNDATLSLLSRTPTQYKLLANSSSPYEVVLDQAYALGWVASVNGKPLPPQDHIRIGSNLSGLSFNGWYINHSGTSTIDIYYAPQTTYLIYMMMGLATFYGIVLYLVITFIKKFYDRKNNGELL